MTDDISFEIKKPVDIPEKGDPVTEKMIQDINKKIQKEGLEGEIREATGTEKEGKKTGVTKDVPQVIFRIIAAQIPCKKFELDDNEAETIAANLNILLPLDGKIAAILVITLIVLNKVYICLDAINAKMGKKKPDEEIGAKLPEQIK
jgi:hypothetical protein